MKPHLGSVRVRLALWYTVTLGVLLVTFSGGVYAFVHLYLTRHVEVDLGDQLATVVRTLGVQLDELGELDEHGAVTRFEVRVDSEIAYRSRDWQAAQLWHALESATHQRHWSWRSSDGHPYRLGSETVELDSRSHQVTVAVSEQAVRETLGALRVTLSIGIPVALAIALLGGYFLADRVLAPVKAITERACEITAERLSDRLPVENPDDEFGRLATVFNGVLTRLEDSFERLRRFTADASHELRTPLTAMRSVGEVALHDNLDAPAYRNVIGSMLEEADRLAHLVDGLLTLTRADCGRVRLRRERLDLSELAREVAEFLRVLAEERNQTLVVKVVDGVHALADRDTVRCALGNILDNAIKFAPTDGQVTVVVRHMSGVEAAVEVIDNGPGIPEKEREKVFERFYRVDQVPARETGGAGLGLAIARWAIEANGGRIEIASQEGRGSAFCIMLPSIGTEAV